MPSSRSGQTEWLTALRQWRYRRRRLGHNYVSQPHILVESDNPNLLESDWLQSALFFSSGRQEFQLGTTPSPSNAVTAADAIEAFVKNGASSYLYLGKSLPIATRRAADFLKISYLHLDHTIHTQENPTALDKQLLPKNHEPISKRYSVLLQLNDPERFPDILQAIRDARLTFPDLLLLVSDEHITTLGQYSHHFIARSDDSKELINSADIVLLPADDDLAAWYGVANAVLFSGKVPHLSKSITAAINTGSAVVLYDTPQTREVKLREVQASGNLWSVRRGGLLSAAVVQSLEPEKSALAVVQAQAMLMDVSPLYSAIDDFLAQDRS